MKLISEPSIDVKIRRMKERVRWQHPQIRQRQIDQTQLAIQGQPDSFDAFSFLVLGDSGTGRHRTSSPQRQVAQQVMANGQSAKFVLHTGDVVYLVGSSEQYRENFIKPYQEWLVGGDAYRAIAYDKMTFKLPFLPVPGNHDYYDLPPLLGIVSGITGPLRYALRSYVDIDVGWHGSHQGNAYAKAFMDYLKALSGTDLAAHLDRHYTSRVGHDRCLTYVPGQFTRLPNRYYSFRYAGIDFFALDSNTFNQPLPVTDPAEAQDTRDRLQARRQRLEAEKAELLKELGATAVPPMEEDDRTDITGELEELDEEIYDIDKQLNAEQTSMIDLVQLDWLRDRLIASWQNSEVRGRILFFHHPPYVTEATKWFQGQTLAVRQNLRRALDAVAAEVGDIARGRPLVDLVLSGHAHCLEYLRTEETGHGDAHIPWVVCGGSGYSLRRQRPDGPALTETQAGDERTVARSDLFVGRTGKGKAKKRPYSGLRVDVSADTPLKLSLTPLLAEKSHQGWTHYSLDTIEV